MNDRREDDDEWCACLPVVNFDTVMGGVGGCASGPGARGKNGDLFPDHLRAIVVGPSNAGKTNAVFNMLFHCNGLNFGNIYVFSKSLYQPKYKFLAEVMSGLEEVGYYPYGDNDEIPPPEDAKPDSVMVFDDVICEKQNNIVSYFTRGRHRAIDVLYLSQTYSKIPKQLVRDNANFLILFRQDDRNLRHVFHDHVTPDMTYEEFRRLCDEAWNRKPRGFLTVDKERDKDGGRYRFDFDRLAKAPAQR